MIHFIVFILLLGSSCISNYIYAAELGSLAEKALIKEAPRKPTQAELAKFYKEHPAQQPVPGKTSFADLPLELREKTVLTEIVADANTPSQAAAAYRKAIQLHPDLSSYLGSERGVERFTKQLMSQFDITEAEALAIIGTQTAQRIFVDLFFIDEKFQKDVKEKIKDAIATAPYPAVHWAPEWAPKLAILKNALILKLVSISDIENIILSFDREMESLYGKSSFKDIMQVGVATDSPTIVKFLIESNKPITEDAVLTSLGEAQMENSPQILQLLLEHNHNYALSPTINAYLGKLNAQYSSRTSPSRKILDAKINLIEHYRKTHAQPSR